jgi:hypothetical protein|tara:strand:- start:761 stop:1114 length:354 start_codon:yes stop_codon:yes gene_type:complete
MGKRKLLNLKVVGHSPKLLNEFINDNKSNIFRETFSGIKHAIRQNKDTAEICSVNTDIAIATIAKKDWESALSSSLGYFESMDQYEMCGDINYTLKLLRNARSTKQSKKISGSATTS